MPAPSPSNFDTFESNLPYDIQHPCNDTRKTHDTSNDTHKPPNHHDTGTTTPANHTAHNPIDSCTCNNRQKPTHSTGSAVRWEELGVAGAALPRLDRLAGQALATAGLLDVQHQFQHITGRQRPAEPI